MTLALPRTAARRWIAACVLAILLHGAVFAVAAMQTDTGGDRSAGQIASQLGVVSMVTQDNLSELMQTVEPVSASSDAEPDKIAEKPPEEVTEPEPEAVQPQVTEQDFETYSTGAAVALPVEPTTDEVEPVEEKPVQEKKKEDITKAPRKATAAVSRSGGGAGGAQSEAASAAELAGYKDRVRARVAGRARSPGGSGVVIVRFTVTSSGGVAGASIVRGASGALNSAALSAVRGGFPPIPAGLPRSISFTVPIQFR
ncbi:MAG: energy transducer TonB [Hyphomicrobiales bacterium]